MVRDASVPIRMRLPPLLAYLVVLPLLLVKLPRVLETSLRVLIPDMARDRSLFAIIRVDVIVENAFVMTRLEYRANTANATTSHVTAIWA